MLNKSCYPTSAIQYLDQNSQYNFYYNWESRLFFHWLFATITKSKSTIKVGAFAHKKLAIKLIHSILEILHYWHKCAIIDLDSLLRALKYEFYCFLITSGVSYRNKLYYLFYFPIIFFECPLFSIFQFFSLSEHYSCGIYARHIPVVLCITSSALYERQTHKTIMNYITNVH